MGSPLPRAKPVRQRGVALISVLLVFALASVIAAEVMFRNFQDIRKTANLINSKQAYHFALAGEQFARQILYRDYKQARSDHLNENWATGLDTFELEHGSMLIEISDLQSRFNINNLVGSNGRPNTTAANQFRRLLAELDIDADFVPALLDWLDSDSVLTSNGAEDKKYLEQDYLTANRPMADRSELRLVHNIGPEDYEKLRQHVVAIPKTIKKVQFNSTKYNLNTLDAKLLTVLAGSSSARVAKRQQQGGYEDLSGWLNSSEGQSLRSIRDQLAVSSEFFEVTVTVQFDQRLAITRTQLFRDKNNGSLTVLKRQQGIE